VEYEGHNLTNELCTIFQNVVFGQIIIIKISSKKCMHIACVTSEIAHAMTDRRLTDQGVAERSEARDTTRLPLG